MIKNIIFDLGGPLVDIDYNLTSKAFKNLGAHNFDEMYTQAKQTELFDLYETGKISSNEFRQQLKSILCIEHIANDDFDNAWNSMIIDFSPKKLSLLKKLKNKYRLFLYSNINEIHIDCVNKIIYKSCQINNLNSFFEKIYLSHLCGFRKPHPESFIKILQDNHLAAEETLFIDDSKQHIFGAQSAGIKAILLTRDLSIDDAVKLAG